VNVNKTESVKDCQENLLGGEVQSMAAARKLLVFAHTPPPHHGQSYMVKLMLEGFGGDVREGGVPDERFSIACYHINCRISSGMEDIGSMRLGKLFRLAGYCVEAIWCRFRHRVTTFYYIPAPGKRAAIYRDWMVFMLCRPFFKKFVLHWHAAGLGDWLAENGTWMEKWLYRSPQLSLVLATTGLRDGLWFRSNRVEVVANGIPDPCPDFEARLLPQRMERLEERRRRLHAGGGGDCAVFKVLYMAHCTRDKGVFDTLDAVVAFRRNRPDVVIQLTVAGSFLEEREEQEFRSRIAEQDLADCVTYAGFVGGAEKVRLFEESDCLCFPTYYRAEAQPVNLIEASAFGLPVVTTLWRGIAEILPPDYPCFVSPKAVEEIAGAFEYLLEHLPPLRAEYLGRFSMPTHLESLSLAIKKV
jgi:glycosyltransferase involved in cell wall biosynthesis